MGARCRCRCRCCSLPGVSGTGPRRGRRLARARSRPGGSSSDPRSSPHRPNAQRFSLPLLGWVHARFVVCLWERGHRGQPWHSGDRERGFPTPHTGRHTHGVFLSAQTGARSGAQAQSQSGIWKSPEYSDFSVGGGSVLPPLPSSCRSACHRCVEVWASLTMRCKVRRA